MIDGLKILLFAANPLGDLKLDEEIRSIEQGIQNARCRDLALLIPALATRPEDLINKISQHDPRVVHFSGHGTGSGGRRAGGRDLVAAAEDVEGQIFLVDANGAPRPVSRDALGDLFRHRRGQICLVVLNACFTRLEAEAISQNVKCVIGTNRAISDQAARVFAARFYQTLADGQSVQQAFVDAQVELKIHGIHEADTLELLTCEGVDPSKLALIDAASNRAEQPSAEDPRRPVLPAAVTQPFRWALANRLTLTLFLGALVVIVAAPFGLARRIEAWTGSQALTYVLLWSPLASVVGLHGIPDYLKMRKARRLVDEGVFGRLKAPGFFRIHPYGDTAQDRDLFERADREHIDVLEWLRTTREPLLYLTGSSGTGKSSLLYAYVLPHSRVDNPSVRIIVERSYHDPIESLRRSVLNLDALRESPPAEAGDVRRLLELACQRLGSKLLIVFDQFEEFLIISECAPGRLKAFEDLIASLTHDPIPVLRVLVVMRSDFLGWLQKLQLPAMRPQENWRDISAFRAVDARAFMERSGLKIGKRLMNEIVSQMAGVEQIHGLIRPITLNMVGLILERMAVPADSESLPQIDRLLDRYLEDCLYDPVVRFHAPAVVGKMITRVGTVQPRSVAELAKSTGLEPYVVAGVLLNLGNRGLVRRIDQTENVWEISHDFVARLLGYLLRSSLAARTRPYIAPALVTAGCVVALAFLLHREVGDQKEVAQDPNPPPVPEAVGALRSVRSRRNIPMRGSPRDESDIRINFGNPKQIIAASDSAADRRQALYFSWDGGVTWRQTLMPLVEGDALHSDSNVDWTSDGTAWSLTIGIDSSTTVLRIRAYKLTDGGMTWAFDGTISGDQTSADCPRMWVDHSRTSPFKDTIYAVWHNNRPAFVNRRTSAGWGVPIQVSGPETTGTAIGGDIKTNEAGEVFAIWPDTGSRNIFFVKSIDGGATFSRPKPLARTFASFDVGVPAFAQRRALIWVSIATFRTAARDDLYVSWVDLSGEARCDSSPGEPGGDVTSTCKSRVWFIRSTDGGLRWESPRKINDSKELNDQFNQRLALDSETGTLGIIYYNTGSASNRKKTNLVFQLSTDHGETWRTPATTVTVAATDETTDNADLGNQYGDANGLTVAKGLFVASWTDRSDDDVEQILTARINVKEGVPVVVEE